jgi:hypothetical protein
MGYSQFYETLQIKVIKNTKLKEIKRFKKINTQENSSHIIGLLHRQLKFLEELDLHNVDEDINLKFFREELENIEYHIMLADEEIKNISVN